MKLKLLQVNYVNTSSFTLSRESCHGQKRDVQKDIKTLITLQFRSYGDVTTHFFENTRTFHDVVLHYTHLRHSGFPTVWNLIVRHIYIISGLKLVAADSRNQTAAFWRHVRLVIYADLNLYAYKIIKILLWSHAVAENKSTRYNNLNNLISCVESFQNWFYTRDIL